MCGRLPASRGREKEVERVAKKIGEIKTESLDALKRGKINLVKFHDGEEGFKVNHMRHFTGRVFPKVAALFFITGSCFINPDAFAASPAPDLLKAKGEAEAKGFIFETSHDEIVAKAKKEGRLRTLSSLDPDTHKAMTESFKKKYPFIDVQMQEITGTEASQRFLLELKAGAAKDRDIAHASEDFYNEWPAHAKKFDILGMAGHGVLRINPRMVDPNHRTMVSVASAVCSIAYNKNRLPAEKVPNTLEDFLKPELKGKKFFVDVRPQCLAALVPGQGEEWVANYARKIKELQPIWVRGNTRALTSIAAGEYVMHQLTYYHSCMRAARKDVTKSLICKIVDPISVRFLENEFVVGTAVYPYAALLFLEHEASPEGQRVLDEVEPVKSHMHAGGEIAKIIKGKKVSINDYSTYHNTPKWMKMVLEAYGFPTAEIK